jgi:thiol-disulfide isomerase/thioredoxin
VVVLNFWASWCAPCEAEAPALEAVQRRLRRSGGTVLGVTYKDYAADSRGFMRRFGVSYPSVRDDRLDLAPKYGTNKLPETFVLDGRGRIVAISRGRSPSGSWPTPCGGRGDGVRRTVALLVALLALGAPSWATAAEPRASFNDIEDEVMCDTCNVPLNIAESPRADQERREIRALIARGLTKDQIKAELKARYGPAVLALPDDNGFSLAVYLVPSPWWPASS